MAADGIGVRVAEGVAQLTLQRVDKRNALTREMLSRLVLALNDVGTQRAVRCVVLAAEGPVFCAGMDLQQVQAAAESPHPHELHFADARAYADVVSTLLTLPVPTVALVQGAAVAGGVGLVAACDLVLATEGAKFSLPEPKRGITASIVTPILRYRVGMSAASFLLLSGREISAHEALRWGLCHHVVSPDQLASFTQELIASILTGSPAALRATKDHLRTCAPIDIVAQLDEAVSLSAAARDTPDAHEGLLAFVQKRPVDWPSLHEPE